MDYSNTLSPLDNRYYEQIKPITNYFSLFNQTKVKAMIEVKYLISLLKYLQKNKSYLTEQLRIPEEYDLDKTFEQLLGRTNNFNDNDFKQIQEYETKCHHDIKAIEYWIRYYYDLLYNGSKYHKYKEFIHFGLTSQDINHTSFDYCLKECVNNSIKPKLLELQILLSNISTEWQYIPILGYTHGQAAVPTKLGKEMLVFKHRLDYCLDLLNEFTFKTKMGGAVGNMNAHKFIYYKLDWEEFFDNFTMEELDLGRWKYTTQITNYENLAHISSIFVMINTIFLDLCQDIWLYCHKDYFKIHKENASQVGSSTMPQKVNPINFENAEGNLKIANTMLNFMKDKLPVSRLQRDLTDSTTLRNYGVGLGHMYLSFENIIKGIKKLEPNIDVINLDLNKHPEVLGEGIQCIFRIFGIENGYDIIREATQHTKFKDEQDFKHSIIELLDKYIDVENDKTKYENIKKMINELSLDNYSGIF